MLPNLLEGGEGSIPHVTDGSFQPEFNGGPAGPVHVALLKRPEHCRIDGQDVLPGVIDGQVSQPRHVLHFIF